MVAYTGVFWQQLRYGLEFDESYNLTVVRNLADGKGYSSNSAFFPGLDAKLFDPFVSTGPVLLLPASAVWTLSDGMLPAVRLVPLAGFAMYLAAAALIGRRTSGRWGALLAVLSPLALATAVPDLTTMSLVPGRLIGEFAACGLVLWATWALMSGRAFTGGLCLGLSAQVKLSFALPAVLIMAIWVVGSSWPLRPLDWKATATAVAAAVLPTAVFELYRLRELGPTGYHRSIGELVAFLRTQSSRSVTDREQRFHSLMGTIPVWAWIFLLGALILPALLRRLRHGASSGRWNAASNPISAYQLVAPAGLVLLSSWLLTSTQSSVRQGLPALLLLLPLAGASAAMPTLQKGTRELAVRHRGALLGVSASLVAVLGAGVVINTLHVWRDDFGDQLLQQQRSAASAIVASGTPSLPVSDWWQEPEMQVLTGLRPEVGPRELPATVRVYTSVQALIEDGRADARVYETRCGEMLYTSAAAVVCRPGMSSAPLGLSPNH